MNEPQHANPLKMRHTVLQLHFDALSFEMVRMRCEVLLQHNLWQQQQRQLQQDNQLLSVALLQAGAQNVCTQSKLMQLTRDSECDALTQTLNRNIMSDRIEQAISMSKRQQRAFALLFIDLDNFKPVNDQYGHAAGDAVLQQVSGRLQAAVRDSDAVSRHGGDEFLLLLNNIKSEQDAGVFAAKLAQMLAQPYQLPQGDISLSASIGVAQYPVDADNAQELIQHADAAMYRMKQRGKACTL